jgi:beta-lactam-binding protein with PASTA domain
MAVLDSKYEILSQHTLSDGETTFDAVAPDGTALRIAWFELSTPQEELQFEKYRQLLRKLERKGLAAIHDIVSRPGTHYVAWYAPSTGWGKASEDLESLLNDYNYTLNHADIRAEQDKGVVYNLGFTSAARIVQPLPVIPEPEVSKPEFRFPDWARNWLMGFLLIFIGLGLGILGFKWRSNDHLVSIPNLIGLDVNEASDQLNALRLAVEARPVASEQTAGTVLSTDPNPSSDLRPGRKVLLTYAVSPGQASQVKVPQLGGEILSSVIEGKLEDAGLNLGSVIYIHAKVPNGIILSQTPEANSQTDADSEVHVLVSLGPKKESFFVPNLIGLSYTEALDLISLAGLPSPKVQRIATTRYLPDRVIEQSIPANTLIAQPNTVIELSVSSQDPLAEIAIPSLVGLNLNLARQIAPGFTLYVQEISTPNLPIGIIDQNPPPGPGTGNAITVVVNVAPVPIPVPLPYITIKEPTPRQAIYRFYIESGISKNSYAQLIAENVQGQRHGIFAGYVSEGKYLEGSWETTFVGPIT